MADIKISQLGAAASISDSQIAPVVDNGTTIKATMAQIKDYTAGGLSNLNTTDKSSPVAAINEINGFYPVYVKTISAVSSLPQTVNDANITSDMVAINAEYSSSSAYVNATVTTANGSVTISGTLSGTTDITLYLMRSR